MLVIYQVLETSLASLTRDVLVLHDYVMKAEELQSGFKVLAYISLF
jgi:hypothetical protein